MATGLKTPGLHHLSLRSTDLERSKGFYVGLLGFPVVMEVPGLLLFAAGRALFGARGPDQATPAGDGFDPFRVGLDHVALVCEDEGELERLEQELAAAGVWTTGVKTDEALGKRYVAFKDPDGIKWEYYMA